MIEQILKKLERSSMVINRFAVVQCVRRFGTSTQDQNSQEFTVDLGLRIRQQFPQQSYQSPKGRHST
jgi:hypothetical protein